MTHAKTIDDPYRDSTTDELHYLMNLLGAELAGLVAEADRRGVPVPPEIRAAVTR